jgi:hypothetical protein
MGSKPRFCAVELSEYPGNVTEASHTFSDEKRRGPSRGKACIVVPDCKMRKFAFSDTGGSG